MSFVFPLSPSNINQQFMFQSSDNLLPEDPLIILRDTWPLFDPRRSITPGESCPLSILIHLNGRLLWSYICASVI